MEIQLAVRDLKRGMYILDLEGKTGIDSSVFSVEGYVLSDKEIPDILAKGFKTVFIDPLRSRPPDSAPEPGVPLTEFDVITVSGPSGSTEGGSVGGRASGTQAGPQSGAQSGLVPAPEVAFQEEYAKVGSLYGKGLEVTRELSIQVLTGSELPVETAQKFMREVLGSVRRNGNALLCLSKMKSKEEYLFSHAVNVSVLAVALGRHLHVKEPYLSELALAGFLHDVGKLFVAREALTHPGKLTPEQLVEVQSHVARGYEYLKASGDIPQMVMDGVLDHHERYGGGGYPNMKQGMDISFGGRLLAVVDVFDALSSRRCYKTPLSPSQALSVMYRDRADTFSPGFVEGLISVLGVFPPGTLVRLSNAQIGVVIESNEDPMRPKVVLLADARGLRVRPRIMDLAALMTISIVEPVARLPNGINIEEAVRSVL